MYKVRLRSVELEDLDTLREWYNVLREYYREYRFISKLHQKKWYENMVDDATCLHYAIDVYNKDRQWQLIGSCNLSKIDWLNRHAELGIYIGDPEWRGSGAGLAAMIELHRIAFHELNMNTMRLEVFSFNSIAVSFFLKFGYQEVGIYRRSQFYKGVFEDSILMDVTREEWEDRYDVGRS